jgi:hypothetical protein
MIQINIVDREKSWPWTKFDLNIWGNAKLQQFLLHHNFMYRQLDMKHSCSVTQSLNAYVVFDIIFVKITL